MKIIARPIEMEGVQFIGWNDFTPLFSDSPDWLTMALNTGEANHGSLNVKFAGGMPSLSITIRANTAIPVYQHVPLKDWLVYDGRQVVAFDQADFTSSFDILPEQSS